MTKMRDGTISRIAAGFIVGTFLAAGVVFAVYGAAALATRSSLQSLMAQLGQYEGSALFYVCVLFSGLLGGSVVTKTVYFFIERPDNHVSVSSEQSSPPTPRPT